MRDLEKEWEKHSAKAIPPMNITEVSKHHFTQGFKAASDEPKGELRKADRRCFSCGGKGTISRQNVKDKMHSPWRHLDRVTITVDLELGYCSVCGNTPVWYDEGKLIDKAVEDSLCKGYLLHSYVLKNSEGFYVNEITNYKVTSVTDSIFKALVFSSAEQNEIEFDGKYSEVRQNFYHISVYTDLLNEGISNRFVMSLSKSILDQTIKERK